MAHKNDEAEETDLGNKRELERTGKPVAAKTTPRGSSLGASAENAGTLVPAGTVPRRTLLRQLQEGLLNCPPFLPFIFLLVVKLHAKISNRLSISGVPQTLAISRAMRGTICPIWAFTVGDEASST